MSSGRDSDGRSQHSSNRVSGISTRTMHQSTTPSLSQTLWPRWASRQFLSLPIVRTLLPVTFAFSLSSESVVMRQFRSERGCGEGHWHADTRGLPWVLPEVVGMVQQVYRSRRRLLRRELEFHVCTINKSAHTKKVCKLIVSTSYITVHCTQLLNLYTGWHAVKSNLSNYHGSLKNVRVAIKMKKKNRHCTPGT